MLIKTNTVLKTLAGETMKDNVNGQAVDATIKMAIVNALLAPKQPDKGVDKVRKYELAKRIYKNDEVDLNEEQIKEIKDCVGEQFTPIVVGQIFELLRV